MRIFLIGFMGAGKTHWGRLISKKMGIPFFDLDELIESDTNKTISEIFEQEGEEYFRTKESEILQWVTETHEAMVLSCGGGAPCFFNNIDYMNEKGITVWLDAPFEILLGRLRIQKSHRPLLKDLDDEQLKAYIIKKCNDRRIYYERAKLRIENQEIKTDDFLKLIVEETISR
ncbi:MAG TPA: shikimate kinase [Niabella sp.]|nr:shikimate kinase [Niabella sp.]HOZ95301.1 shikimate kinase [Niabella sp.]HQW14845.1 shikimate kinase [Niabella sp.]HQX18530.1 shikimate kinase [Niabella sp.]HQX40750.1 shikimate kinase [Niabella sp.]